MKILELFQSFQTQEQAVGHLEAVRWRGRPVCPYCGSEQVCHHASGDRKGQRWQCQACTRAFAVTVGTIFHGTHIPLKSWFLVLALMLNTKKSASSCQIARDLGMRQPTVWSMMHRARAAMMSDADQNALLRGIVEADETYIGGRPRRDNKRTDGKSSKRGRGTAKAAVIGVIERGGRVAAGATRMGKLSNKGLASFIMRFVDTQASLLITDEYSGYHGIGRLIQHTTINHSVSYVDGQIHTNNIQGFWAHVKRAWYGSHHHCSRRYLPRYISESGYKFSVRKSVEDFGGLLATMTGA